MHVGVTEEDIASVSSHLYHSLPPYLNIYSRHHFYRDRRVHLRLKGGDISLK
jgi:hypothetical protein